MDAGEVVVHAVQGYRTCCMFPILFESAMVNPVHRRVDILMLRTCLIDSDGVGTVPDSERMEKLLGMLIEV